MKKMHYRFQKDSITHPASKTSSQEERTNGFFLFLGLQFLTVYSEGKENRLFFISTIKQYLLNHGKNPEGQHLHKPLFLTLLRISIYLRS